MGHCVERLAFLLVVNKYLKNWMRAVLYIGSDCAILYTCTQTTQTTQGGKLLFERGLFSSTT